MRALCGALIVVASLTIASLGQNEERRARSGLWLVHDLSAEGGRTPVVGGLAPARGVTYDNIRQRVGAANWAETDEDDDTNDNKVRVTFIAKNTANLTVAPIAVLRRPTTATARMTCVWLMGDKVKVRSAADTIYFFVDNDAVAAAESTTVSKADHCVDILKKLSAKLKAETRVPFSVFEVHDLSVSGASRVLEGLTPVRGDTYAKISRNIRTANREILTSAEFTAENLRHLTPTAHSPFVDSILVTFVARNTTNVAFAPIAVLSRPTGGGGDAIWTCVWRMGARAEIENMCHKVYFFVDNDAVAAAAPEQRNASAKHDGASSTPTTPRAEHCATILKKLSTNLQAEPKPGFVLYSVYDRNGTRIAKSLIYERKVADLDADSMDGEKGRDFEDYRAKVSKITGIALAPTMLWRLLGSGPTICVQAPTHDRYGGAPEQSGYTEELVFFEAAAAAAAGDNVTDACPRAHLECQLACGAESRTFAWSR